MVAEYEKLWEDGDKRGDGKMFASQWQSLIAAAAASYSGLQTNFSYSEINEFLVTHKPHSDKNLEGAEAKED